MGRADEFCANAEPNKAAKLNSLNISLTDGSNPSIQAGDQAALSSLRMMMVDVNGTSAAHHSPQATRYPSYQGRAHPKGCFPSSCLPSIGLTSQLSLPSMTPTEGLSLRGCIQLLVHTGTKVPDSSPLVIDHQEYTGLPCVRHVCGSLGGVVA